MGHAFRLAVREYLYVQSYRQAVRIAASLLPVGILAGTRNTSTDPPDGLDRTNHQIASGRSSSKGIKRTCNH